MSAIPTLQSWTGDDENESKLNVAITELSMHLLKEEFKQQIKILYENIMYWAHFYSMLIWFNAFVFFLRKNISEVCYV